MNSSIVILTRTYFKDSKILQTNLLSTANIFLNRNKYKIGIILDLETLEDRQLGQQMLEQNLVDFVHYEDLPNNHLSLFQALAYPSMHWGYDRQQWSTFYMDTFVTQDIIGIVDSDSTFTSYLTDENIFSKDGKIKLLGLKPLDTWKHWSKESENYIFKNGAQHINDDVALKFQTEYDLMATNIMPMFFWKSTFQNFRNYIETVWNMSFDEAYKIFSRRPYCQFNILANYVLKFENDKYEFVDLKMSNNEKVCVAQNGCPTSRDTLCGAIRSFNIEESKLQNVVIQSSSRSSFGNIDINLSYFELKNDLRHANNFAHFINNSCSDSEIDEHYTNVYRDINKLTGLEANDLYAKINHFIENSFNRIIIKG